MSAGWSLPIRDISHWLQTVSFSAVNAFLIDCDTAIIFHKVIKCYYLRKIFLNNSNVHVCSLARASITRHLCCRI